MISGWWLVAALVAGYYLGYYIGVWDVNRSIDADVKPLDEDE